MLFNLFQVIDLTSVSQELAYLANDADLVILEGMVSSCKFSIDLAVCFQFILISFASQLMIYVTAFFIFIISFCFIYRLGKHHGNIHHPKKKRKKENWILNMSYVVTIIRCVDE